MSKIKILSLLAVAITAITASYYMTAKPLEVQQAVDASEAVRVLNEVEGIAPKIENPTCAPSLMKK